MSNSRSRAGRLAIVAAAGLISLALSLPALAVDTGGGGGGGSSSGGGGGSSSGGGGGSSSNSGGSSSGGMAPAMSAPMAQASKVHFIDLDDARKLIAKSNWRGAIKLLRQIVVQQPRNADALNLLGYSLRQSGQMAEAESWYLKALKLKPNHLGANEYLGELYVMTGHVDKAKIRLAAIAKICGNTSCEEYKDLAGAIAAKG